MQCFGFYNEYHNEYHKEFHVKFAVLDFLFNFAEQISTLQHQPNNPKIEQLSYLNL